MLNYHIRTIPHKTQDYNTPGDYWVDSQNHTKIVVSEELGDDSAFLVALHEFVEDYLCKKRGIKNDDVVAFDKANINNYEPGMMPSAPYHKEHVFADLIERQVCRELGIEWTDHDNKNIEVMDTYDN